jgi:hypothetical protein
MRDGCTHFIDDGGIFSLLFSDLTTQFLRRPLPTALIFFLMRVRICGTLGLWLFFMTDSLGNSVLIEKQPLCLRNSRKNSFFQQRKPLSDKHLWMTLNRCTNGRTYAKNCGRC